MCGCILLEENSLLILSFSLQPFSSRKLRRRKKNTFAQTLTSLDKKCFMQKKALILQNRRRVKKLLGLANCGFGFRHKTPSKTVTQQKVCVSLLRENKACQLREGLLVHPHQHLETFPQTMPLSDYKPNNNGRKKGAKKLGQGKYKSYR